jgi:endoglucanase Acf2
MRFPVLAGVLMMSAAPCLAQQVVPVGKGSYASSVPAGAPAGQPEGRAVYVLDQKDRALPTNQYWTQLMVKKGNNQLWSYPFRVDVTGNGLDLQFPSRWLPDGGEPICDNPLTISGANFKPSDTNVKSWSDWLINFRMAASDKQYMDVTVGEGMPCVWVEFAGVSPVLTFRAAAKTFGQADDCIGVETGGHVYGVFAPDGTKFESDAKSIKVTFKGEKQYLVVAAMPGQKDLETFHKYAYAIPRDSKVTWQWDSVKALATTKWTLTTEALKGTEKQVIQGWIPHHYRKTTNDLKFVEGLNYLSPRGPLKCSVGNEFNIAWEYTGIIPNLPAPKKLGLDHDFDLDRMHKYFTTLIDEHRHPKNENDVHFVPDTYWGGKDILRFGQMGLMTQQLKDPTHDDFVKDLRVGMEDWYTYTPGEKHHYFTRYPKWHALVGVNTSYGSENFNDHHFHYGYFTFASALLGMQDRSFIDDFGGMATLVGKEYANYDRTDKDFPFMRTYDLWAGHGWADGMGGNNQESTSEDVQSSAGLVYLGQATGNQPMTEAGIVTYAMTTQSALEYWFNQGGDVFPPEWKAPSVGILRSGRKEFTKFFQGDDAWIFAIQWLPTSPMLSYLARDPAYARGQFDKMLARAKSKGQATSVKGGWGAGLGNVLVGYVAQYDPQWAVEQLDEVATDPKIDVAYEWAVIYYQAHSMRNLGLVDWKVHGSSPTTMTYWNEKTKTRTFVAWNPTAQAETVTFYEGGQAIGTVVAQPQALTSVNTLIAIK